MNWLLFALSAYLVVSVLVYISRIGKEREPISPDDAIVALLLVGVIIGAMVMAGLRLT